MDERFRKFQSSSEEEPMEDFVLMQPEELAPRHATETPEAVSEDSAEVPVSAMDDTGEIPCIYEDMLTAETESDSEEASSSAPKKNLGKGAKALLSVGITVFAVALLFAAVFGWKAYSNPLRGYQTASVSKGNVIDSFETSGTLSAGARYEITSLVSGKVVLAGFESGETVSAGSVLYKLDDTEAKLSVERAKAQLSKAQNPSKSTSTSSNKIYSTAEGTVYTVNVRSGSAVSYGQVIATIMTDDGSVVSVSSPYAGTVSALYATQGRAVSINSQLALITTKTTTEESANVYDQKSSKLDVQAAEAYLENFTIKSPVDGVIVEKNAKVGDNVSITGDKPMMVILDTTHMKFTFRVNEYEIRDLSLGMKAVVKAESIPEESYAGEITRISSEGMPAEDGKPLFEVDITIEEPGELKPGMQVTATVIRDSSNNTLYLPKKALMEADGETALVLVEKIANTPELDSDSIDEELAYPWIKIPEGYKLVRVSYGVADETNVEILFGLELEDQVAFLEDAEPVDLHPAITPVPEDMEDAPSDAADNPLGELPTDNADAEKTPAASPEASPAKTPEKTASGLKL